MQLSTKVLLIFLSFLMISEGFSQEVDQKKLIQHISYLSSDELAGRRTLSEGSKMAQEYIISEFEEYELKTHYVDYKQAFSFQNRRENKEYENAINIVGFVPGTESRKIIVVTGHYDHLGIGKANAAGDSIFNGADDNASGTSAMMALAEYFAQNPPLHPMMFVAFDAEEMGLQGAKAFLEDFPFELEDILLNINMDMIGRNENGELYASGTFHNPELKPILEKASIDSYPQLLFGHDDPNSKQQDWSQSSDHGPFLSKGIPHIYFGVEDHPDYHKQSDDFLGIEPSFFVAATNLILNCILELDQSLPID